LDLINRKPDISQPEARNRSPEEIVTRDVGNQRKVIDEIVLPPKRRPGKDEEEDPQLRTKYDVYYGQ
jgi:hypothetical protein